MSSNWWSNKLGTTPQPQQPNMPQQQPVYQQPTQQPQSYPTSQQTVPMTPRCPGCNSGNYGGTAESRPRCYDCGYPIQQSGSGAGTGIVGQGGGGGPATPATQVPTGGFNPTTIIGRLE